MKNAVSCITYGKAPPGYLQEIKGNYAKAIQALKEAQHVVPHNKKVKNALLKLEGRNSEE